jgi:tetratricopeptide (TPR) repeat protein
LKESEYSGYNLDCHGAKKCESGRFMKTPGRRSRKNLHERALKGRADTLDLVGRHADAILDFNASLEGSPGARKKVEVQIGLFKIYDKMGENEKARDLAMRALRDSRKQRDDELVGISLISVAFSYINRGKFNDALKSAKGALAHLRKAIKKQGLSRADKRRIKGYLADGFNSMGHINNQRGRYPDALMSLKKGLKLAEDAENQMGIITFINNIGWTYKLMNDHPHAIGFFSRAMELAQRIGYKNAIATIVGNLGLVSHELAEYDKALSYFQRALEINGEMGSQSGIAINLNNMANVYLDQKELERAEKLFSQSLGMFERIGYHFGTAMVLSNLGIIHFGKKRFKKALEFVKRSEKLVAKSGIVEIGMRNAILKGRILRETGKLRESLGLLDNVIRDSEHFEMKDIFIGSVIAYVETVCAGKSTFSKKLYGVKGKVALLLRRAEKIAEELGLRNMQGDIASVKEKWQEVIHH